MATQRKKYDSVELKPLASAGAQDEQDDDMPEFKSKTDQWLNFALHKLHALLWIVIASALAVWTDLFEVIVEGHPPARPHAELNQCVPPRLNLHRLVCPLPAARLSLARRFWFAIGLTGFGGWLLMAAYLIIWVKYIKKFPGEWEDYWPQAIPIATFCAISSLIAFVVAFWPVWGWLTIPGIFVLFLGVLNLAHFVPVRPPRHNEPMRNWHAPLAHAARPASVCQARPVLPLADDDGHAPACLRCRAATRLACTTPTQVDDVAGRRSGASAHSRPLLALSSSLLSFTFQRSCCASALSTAVRGSAGIQVVGVGSHSDRYLACYPIIPNRMLE
jgi:hypothetical protein